MSADRFFLQHRVRDLDESPAYQPISRVRIHAGEDGDGNPIVYEAGNTTGRTIDVDNPLIMDDASGGAIAAHVLDVIQGYAYKPYSAGGAILDPAAEIGDAVSIDEVYSVLADIETIFSPLMTANIGAREDGSIDHEYPYESSADREIAREIQGVRTSFIVENGRIATEIANINANAQGLTNRVTRVEQTADGIRADLSANYMTSNQVQNSITSAVNVSAQNITTQVSRTYELKTDAAAKLNTAKQYADTQDNGVKGELRSEISQTADSIKATVAGQESKWDTSQLPSGVSISAYGYGIPSSTTAAQYRNKYYLDQSSGRYYKSNGTSWVLQTQQLQLITSNLKSSIEINANDIRSVVSDMSATQNAVSSISQRVDNITMYVSSANGSTTFTLTDGTAILDTKTFEVTVDSFNVVGPITATSVAANSYIQAPIIYDMGGWGYLHMESVSSSGQLIYGSSSSASIGSSYWGIAADPVSGPVSMYIAGVEMMRGSVYLPGYVYLYGTWDFRGATVYLPS